MTLVEFEWQKAGFDANLGLDKHFHDRAKVDGKAVQGLETVEFQVSLFDQMTADEQDHMLANSLKNIDTEQANVVKLTNAWKAGDVATVERIMLDDVKDDPAHVSAAPRRPGTAPGCPSSRRSSPGPVTRSSSSARRIWWDQTACSRRFEPRAIRSTNSEA